MLKDMVDTFLGEIFSYFFLNFLKEVLEINGRLLCIAKRVKIG